MKKFAVVLLTGLLLFACIIPVAASPVAINGNLVDAEVAFHAADCEECSLGIMPLWEECDGKGNRHGSRTGRFIREYWEHDPSPGIRAIKYNVYACYWCNSGEIFVEVGRLYY